MSLFRTAHILSRVFLLLLLFIACVCVNKIEKRTRAKRERERKKWPKKGANPFLRVAREERDLKIKRDKKKAKRRDTLSKLKTKACARAVHTNRETNKRERINNNARVVLLLSDVVVFVGVVVPRRRR